MNRKKEVESFHTDTQTDTFEEGEPLDEDHGSEDAEGGQDGGLLDVVFCSTDDTLGIRVPFVADNASSRENEDRWRSRSALFDEILLLVNKLGNGV